MTLSRQVQEDAAAASVSGGIAGTTGSPPVPVSVQYDIRRRNAGAMHSSSSGEGDYRTKNSRQAPASSVEHAQELLRRIHELLRDHVQK